MEIQVSFRFAMALTKDAYLANQKYIKPFYENLYWLATGTVNYFKAYAVRDTGELEPVDGLLNLAVRPCLFAENICVNNLNKYIGKFCTIDATGERLYTILPNGLVIANFSIYQGPFIDLDSIVREANKYDNSEIKRRIDIWFKSHFEDKVMIQIKD